jgi:hypothetical protein
MTKKMSRMMLQESASASFQTNLRDSALEVQVKPKVEAYKSPRVGTILDYRGTPISLPKDPYTLHQQPQFPSHKKLLFSKKQIL